MLVHPLSCSHPRPLLLRWDAFPTVAKSVTTILRNKVARPTIAGSVAPLPLSPFYLSIPSAAAIIILIAVDANDENEERREGGSLNMMAEDWSRVF